MAVIQSAADTTVQTVDPTMTAMRIAIKSDEQLGSFQYAGATGNIASATAAGTIFSFRWAPGTGTLAIIKRISIAAASGTTTTNTAALVGVGLYAARSFLAADSAGTPIAPLLGNNNKYRGSFVSSMVTDMRISTTTTLTAGTRTLDSQPLGSTYFWVTSAVGTYLPFTNLISYNVNDYPLVLQNNEGFTINTLTATPTGGTLAFSINIEWFETYSY